MIRQFSKVLPPILLWLLLSFPPILTTVPVCSSSREASKWTQLNLSSIPALCIHPTFTFFKMECPGRELTKWHWILQPLPLYAESCIILGTGSPAVLFHLIGLAGSLCGYQVIGIVYYPVLSFFTFPSRGRVEFAEIRHWRIWGYVNLTHQILRFMNFRFVFVKGNAKLHSWWS